MVALEVGIIQHTQKMIKNGTLLMTVQFQELMQER